MPLSDEEIQQALQQWQSGNQAEAVATLAPHADANDPSALGLICWFLHQMPERWREGVEYAKKAASLGNPWVVSYFVPNLANNPEGHQQAIDLIALSPMGGWPQADPISLALNLQATGYPNVASAAIRAASESLPWPSIPQGPELQERVRQINEAAVQVNGGRDQALKAFSTSEEEVESRRENFITRSKTLSELLDNLTNASSQKFFEDEATKYEQESKRFWIAGVLILSVAAAAALLPLILNYVDQNHALHGQSNVSAHLGATLAFAAVAGVLLARARGRDRSRQRARDLSVALGTMFAYSEQIANDEEKQRFKHDMGRLILESFIRQDSIADEGSRSIVGAITDKGPAEPRQEPVT